MCSIRPCGLLDQHVLDAPLRGCSTGMQWGRSIGGYVVFTALSPWLPMTS
jgi:hypothetical protein